MGIKLFLVLVVMMSIGIADAAYMDDTLASSGDGIWFWINTSWVDSWTCCDSDTLSMGINGSTINFTIGNNKTITSPLFLSDNMTVTVSGTAGYTNVSAIMANASQSYNLTANGAFIESRNTTASRLVWFNYTNGLPATLTISWNNSNSPSPPVSPTYIPPVPTGCSSLNGTNWINLTCSAGAGNVTDGMNFTNTNLGTWNNNSLFYWNNTGLAEGTLYTYHIFAWNNTGLLSLTYATVINTTNTTPSTAPPHLTQVSPAVFSVVASGTSNTFTTSTSDPISNYYWTEDSLAVTGTSTYTASYASGLHYIKVYADNSYGTSNTLEWRVSVNRLMAVTAVPTINITPYNEIKVDIRSFNVSGALGHSIAPYSTALGSSTLLWIFLWLMVFCAYWIRQRQVTFPTVIALIFGGVIIGTLPEEYQIYAKGLVAVGMFAVVYMFFTERRQ